MKNIRLSLSILKLFSQYIKMTFCLKLMCFTSLLLMISMSRYVDAEDDDSGVYYPTQCEVCKYLAVELEDRLDETGKIHEVIETGYDTMNDAGKKRKKYANSELRLIESLQGICDRILEYNIHKERKDSTRFAKGMSETFRTLHGLVDKGVKVDLGIPYDLWDKPSVEVVTLKTHCETLLEKYEEDIEDWFFHHQHVSLKDFLCSQRALKKGDDDCLVEIESDKDRPSKEKGTLKKETKENERPKDEF